LRLAQPTITVASVPSITISSAPSVTATAVATTGPTRQINRKGPDKITRVAKPDLTIDVHDVLPAWDLAQGVKAFHVKITNEGDAATTTAFQASLTFEDDGTTETITVSDPLEAGESVYRLIQHTYQDTGIFTVTAQVDTTNAINESDETNNLQALAVEMNLPASNNAPTITFDSDSYAVDEGQNMTAVITVRDEDFDTITGGPTELPEGAVFGPYAPQITLAPFLNKTMMLKDILLIKNLTAFGDVPTKIQGASVKKYQIVYSPGFDVADEDSDPATVQIPLEFTDGEDTTSATLTILVNDVPQEDPENETENQAPVAVLTVTPTEGTAPLNITVDATGSSDSDGNITSYTVTIQKGEDYVSSETFTSLTTEEYSLAEAGDYIITLIVVDDDEDSSEASATVHVTDAPVETTPACSDGIDNDGDGLEDLYDPGCTDGTDNDETDEGGEGNETANVAPTAVLTVTPLNGTAPLAITIDATGSFDSDGTIQAFVLEITEAEAEEGSFVYADTFTIFSAMEYTLAVEGIYTVTLTVVDDDEATGTASEIVTVILPADGNETGDGNETDGNETANVDPTAVLGVTPLNGTAPLNITIDATGSSDSDGNITSYTIMIQSGLDYVYSNTSATTSPIEYTLQDAGEYTVTLVVVDDDEGSAQATVTVTVSAEGDDTNETDDGNETEDDDNLAPEAEITFTPLNLTAPANVTIDGSGSHDDDGSITAHSWVISGPGGYSHVEAENAGAPAQLNLTFTTAGSYTVMLVVLDDDGAANSGTITIPVNAAATSGNTTGDGNETDDDDDTDDDDTDDVTENAPVVSDVEAESITKNSAKITWTTDLSSNSKVLFGTDDDDLDETESRSTSIKSHSVTLTELEANTKYYYKVVSCTSTDKCIEKGTYKFTTLAATTTTTSSSSSDDESLLDQNMNLLSKKTTSSAQTTSKTSATVSHKDAETDNVEIVYSAPQYMEVEEEVCKFKFLFWCVWKETIVHKVLIPALTAGVEFVV
jgi:hypothetical protein